MQATAQFRVEDYRKPEYQVRVSPAKPRLLQGETMQVVIDARYFFGEPVSNAQVKYRVYHSPHYWWDEEGGGEGGRVMERTPESDDATRWATTPPSSPSRPANSTPTASSPSACPPVRRERDASHGSGLHRRGCRHRSG